MSRNPHSPSADELLREHEMTITTALRVYQEHMSEAAAEAHAAYDTLTADPERRAEHDASHPLITSNGYHAAADLLRHRADRAQAARQAITHHLNPDLDDDEAAT